MPLSDIFSVLHWWIIILGIGLLFLPFVSRIFSTFLDKGYIFSKILGIICLSYLVFLFGTLHLLAFSQINTLLLMLWVFILAVLLFAKRGIFLTGKDIFSFIRAHVVFFLIEEIIFLLSLFLWSYVRGFQPDIHGLEKFMDFGFVNSILRSNYFPPKDMWYTPLPINYYYFGHLVTAVLTRLSGISPAITFNLMIASIFAFCFSASFSIGGNLIEKVRQQKERANEIVKHIQKTFIQTLYFTLSGLLTGFLVTCSGNLHTIYTLFKPYQNDFPVPFWQLAFSPLTYPNAYWYPNATRFIYHTIHEFPMYSFVVSDLHGHVLDIPVVLTTIALLFSFLSKKQETRSKQISIYKKQNSKNINWTLRVWNLFASWWLDTCDLLLISFLLAVMYMTNAWDALIYFIFSAVIIVWKATQVSTIPKEESIKSGPRSKQKYSIPNTIYHLLVIIVGYFIFSLPFSFFFQPGALVGGIGMVCPPQFLITIGKIGPFYFEANHCMHSPLWQLLILYGFFLFWGIGFGMYFWKKLRKHILTPSHLFVMLLFCIGLLLIIIPEFAYMRDIYTTYFRANTMFKLVYQAFILLSLASAFTIVTFFSEKKNTTWLQKVATTLFLFGGLLLLGLVGQYPFLSTPSYYNTLQKYSGLNGINYLATLYPSDYEAINWLNAHIQGQPVIVEAQGDSYTDYERISANTGLPTILGWGVHEWLWRGTYDIVPPRAQDIQTLYETTSMSTAKQIIQKYNIQLVYIGDMERKKYIKLSGDKFYSLGKVIYQNGSVTIFSLYHE